MTNVRVVSVANNYLIKIIRLGRLTTARTTKKLHYILLLHRLVVKDT